VRGTYYPEKSDNEPVSDCDKSLRVEMHAEIITLDRTVLEKLKN
jgi:hypothetical protein